MTGTPQNSFLVLYEYQMFRWSTKYFFYLFGLELFICPPSTLVIDEGIFFLFTLFLFNCLVLWVWTKIRSWLRLSFQYSSCQEIWIWPLIAGKVTWKSKSALSNIVALGICSSLSLTLVKVGSFCHGSVVINLTSIHDNAGSIPGLTQWVKDLTLQWVVV